MNCQLTTQNLSPKLLKVKSKKPFSKGNKRVLDCFIRWFIWARNNRYKVLYLSQFKIASETDVSRKHVNQYCIPFLEELNILTKEYRHRRVCAYRLNALLFKRQFIKMLEREFGVFLIYGDKLGKVTPIDEYLLTRIKNNSSKSLYAYAHASVAPRSRSPGGGMNKIDDIMSKIGENRPGKQLYAANLVVCGYGGGRYEPEGLPKSYVSQECNRPIRASIPAGFKSQSWEEKQREYAEARRRRLYGTEPDS